MKTERTITLTLTAAERRLLCRALRNAGKQELAARLSAGSTATATPAQIASIASLPGQGRVAQVRRLALTSYILQTGEQGAPGGPRLYPVGEGTR